MSTLKEISESKLVITLKPKERFLQAFNKDFVKFSLLIFCIYISMGSKFWTFVTGLMFLSFLWAQTDRILKKSVTTFKTKQEAIDYIQNCDLGEGD